MGSNPYLGQRFFLFLRVGPFLFWGFHTESSCNGTGSCSGSGSSGGSGCSNGWGIVIVVVVVVVAVNKSCGSNLSEY